VKKIRSRVPGIPHLQLFGQLADLRNYRVRGVMAGKIILAEEAGTKKLVVFKTLHKAPAVYKKAKTSLLPINIAHMVKLLKYFETDDCVYLMLCGGSLLRGTAWYCRSRAAPTAVCLCQTPSSRLTE